MVPVNENRAMRLVKSLQAASDVNKRNIFQTYLTDLIPVV